jgi:hypothetical protein
MSTDMIGHTYQRPPHGPQPGGAQAQRIAAPRKFACVVVGTHHALPRPHAPPTPGWCRGEAFEAAKVIVAEEIYARLCCNDCPPPVDYDQVSAGAGAPNPNTDKPV